MDGEARRRIEDLESRFTEHVTADEHAELFEEMARARVGYWIAPVFTEIAKAYRTLAEKKRSES